MVATLSSGCGGVFRGMDEVWTRHRLAVRAAITYLGPELEEHTTYKLKKKNQVENEKTCILTTRDSIYSVYSCSSTSFTLRAVKETPISYTQLTFNLFACFQMQMWMQIRIQIRIRMRFVLT